MHTNLCLEKSELINQFKQLDNSLLDYREEIDDFCKELSCVSKPRENSFYKRASLNFDNEKSLDEHENIDLENDNKHNECISKLNAILNNRRKSKFAPKTLEEHKDIAKFDLTIPNEFNEASVKNLDLKIKSLKQYVRANSFQVKNKTSEEHDLISRAISRMKFENFDKNKVQQAINSYSETEAKNLSGSPHKTSLDYDCNNVAFGNANNFQNCT